MIAILHDIESVQFICLFTYLTLLVDFIINSDLIRHYLFEELMKSNIMLGYLCIECNLKNEKAILLGIQLKLVHPNAFTGRYY